MTGKYEPADLGQLSGYMAIAKHVLNTPVDNQPVGLLICREHNRVLAKYHLEELGLPMGITDYELKKVLPTKAQLAKCVTDAERQIAGASMARHTNPSNSETGRRLDELRTIQAYHSHHGCGLLLGDTDRDDLVAGA